MEAPSGPWCAGDEMGFQLRDPARRWAAVRLRQHVGLTGDLAFRYADDAGSWQLRLPHPPVHRLEYQLDLHHRGGDVETVCDPGNPRRVAGPFGESSVLCCPDYRDPDWLRMPQAPGRWWQAPVPLPAVGAPLGARIWSPTADTDRVLVAHDGPDYDRYAALGRYTAAMIAAGRVPPYHLVLLPAGERDEWYSASPAYARALATAALPRLRDRLGSDRPVVAVGASLGALALVHAQRRHPEAFAGLLLQSGSFFQPRYDRHESRFRRYLRIVRFTGRVLRSTDGPAVPTTLTCGRIEENLRNNRDMAHALHRHGYGGHLAEVPDAHTWVGWRDALDPHLTDLLRTVWNHD